MNRVSRLLDRTVRSDRPAEGLARWSAPIRVQFWFRDECVGQAPIRIIDGVADDLKWRPTRTVMIDRLVFVHNNTRIASGVFVHRLDQPMRVEKGELLRLALAHLQLRNKFGYNILG